MLHEDDEDDKTGWKMFKYIGIPSLIMSVALGVWYYFHAFG